MSELPCEFHHESLTVLGAGLKVEVLTDVGVGFVFGSGGVVEAEQPRSVARYQSPDVPPAGGDEAKITV